MPYSSIGLKDLELRHGSKIETRKECAGVLAVWGEPMTIKKWQGTLDSIRVAGQPTLLVHGPDGTALWLGIPHLQHLQC